LCKVYANDTVVDLALGSYLRTFRKQKSIYSEKKNKNIDFESYSAELLSLLSHKALGFITTWVRLWLSSSHTVASDQNFSSQLIYALASSSEKAISSGFNYARHPRM